MEILFLILLIISIPIFYIYGIVSYLRNHSGNKKSVYSLSFLKDAAKKGKTLSEVIHELEKSTETPSPSVSTISTTTIVTPQKEKHSQSSVSENWYANNSINLLLYLGAFLIVTAAAIFVGFQWEALPGTIKAGLLTLLTFAFFATGVWLHNIPKVKTAGQTFLMIGAVLIPVSGAAWQNFVFSQMHTPLGFVWLATSMIAGVTYLMLAREYKSTFYAYAMHIATLSFSLSLVNTFSLEDNFYIVAAMLSCFVLLLVEYFTPKDKDMLLTKSANISANVIMPFSILYGFSSAIAQDKLFTLEATLAVILAGCFYLTAYITTKKVYNLALAYTFFPVAIYLFSQYQKMNDLFYLYGNIVLSVIYLATSLLFREKETKTVTYWSGILVTYVVFQVASSLNLAPIHHAILAAAPGIIALLVAYLSLNPYYILFTTVSSVITFHIIFQDMYHIKSYKDYLAGLYAGLGTLSYVSAILIKDTKKPLFRTTILSSIFYFCIAIFASTTHPQYLAMINFLCGALLTHAAWYFTFSSTLLYIANSFFYGSLFFLTTYYEESYTGMYKYSPLYFSGLSFLLYTIGFLPKNKEQRDVYHTTGIFGMVATSMVSFIMGTFEHFTVFGKEKGIELYGLISAYLCTGLLGFDSVVRKIKHMGYMASAAGIATYLWQMYYMGFTEIQLYTGPLGIYFMALAYTRRLQKDEENRKVLDIVGLFLLITPTFIQSLGENNIQYSILLGIEAFCVIALGISLSYNVYKIAGSLALVLAVIPQTYLYIAALPRWLIVGIAGFAFVAIAVFLLLRRKETTK